MESSKKIFNNHNVLQSIFRYLEFEDHLKLIKVCPQFEDAIVHGVWRLMYNDLNIEQSSTRGNFLLQYNEINNVKTEHSLTPEELLKILHHSSMYIQKLELKYIQCLEDITSLKYDNLTELKLLRTVVEGTHLQQVAENCLNLQSLSLEDFNFRNRSNIRPNVFGEMKALNKLEIKGANFNAWNYFDVQQLFCFPHLKTLIIDIDIRDSNDNKGNDNNGIERVYNIENLEIGKLPSLQSRNVCFLKNLIRFENLTKLSIKLVDKGDSITNNVLTHINNKCLKLYELSFSNCELSFNEFPHMNNLMHLTFDFCKNLSLENVNEIFRKLKLKSLSLIGVEMRNEANDISDYNYTSNTLETLIIKGGLYDAENVPTFVNRQHKFENVSKVKLAKGIFCFGTSTELCFSHNFPNLQELIMDYFYISSEDILHLKHLKVLKFHQFDGMSWPYLKILFQHPTLTHITITPTDLQDFEMRYEHLPNCCEGLTTTLEYLSLPSVVYERDLSFWTSFLQRNKLLKLDVDKGDVFLRDLILQLQDIN